MKDFLQQGRPTLPNPIRRKHRHHTNSGYRLLSLEARGRCHKTRCPLLQHRRKAARAPSSPAYMKNRVRVASSKGRVLIGTSGRHYGHRIGQFYPHGLQPSDFLSYCANRFHSIEIDSTFHRSPDKCTVGPWRRAVPKGSFAGRSGWLSDRTIQTIGRGQVLSARRNWARALAAAIRKLRSLPDNMSRTPIPTYWFRPSSEYTPPIPIHFL